MIVIKNVRLSYFHALKGKLNEKGDRVWSTTLLIPKDHPQVDAIKAAINEAKEKNKEKLGKGPVKSPLLDGDAKDDGEYRYASAENRGMYLLRASNYNRAPAIVDQNKIEILDDSDIYSGAYANVVINFYAYNSGTNKGISPGLEAIQKKRDGERLSGGGVNVDDVFDVEDDDDYLG